MIPIYNYQVTKLVEELSGQCQALGIAYELLCYDDGSGSNYLEANKHLATLSGVTYRALEHNLGRAKIRNLLAQESKYDRLIFLDCDSGIAHSNFIRNYIDAGIVPSVINGGRIYKDEQPEERYLLHWKYGHERESQPVKIRIQHPIKYFHSNNFLIKKEVMLSHPFDESIAGYGYEDLQFASVLQQNNISITHIDNPVIHLDLHEPKVFIQKAEKAIDNLIALEERGIYLGTHLQDLAHKIIKYKLKSPYLKLYPLGLKLLMKRLYSSKPSILLLNLYKLNYYLQKKSWI